MAAKHCTLCGINMGRLDNLIWHTRHAQPDGLAGITGELDGAPATGDAAIDDMTLVNWTAIRTYHMRCVVMNLINVRTWNGRDVRAA